MGQTPRFPSALLSFLWTLILVGFSILAAVVVMNNADWLLASIDLPTFLAQPLGQQSEVPIVRTLAGVLAGFLTFFLVAYILPALVDAARLAMINRSLYQEAGNDAGDGLEQTPSSRQWPFYPLFNRLWQDYASALHEQVNRAGENDLPKKYRAMLPAEHYFDAQSLVDTPMRVEFFRHLPGILTGAGIVSTFAGILYGLSEFNPTVPPEEVAYQLKHLFNGVSTAFVASFFAIFAAILVTMVEKFLLYWRYAQVELLQRHIDDLYQGGVESDYLAQLVQKEEENSKKQDASVTLRGSGTEIDAEVVKLFQNNLLSRLESSLTAANSESAKQLQDSIREGLAEPMQLISSSLQDTLKVQNKQYQIMRPMAVTLLGMEKRLGEAYRGLSDQVGGLRQEMGLYRQGVEAERSKSEECLGQLDGRLQVIGNGIEGGIERLYQLLGSNRDKFDLLQATIDRQSTQQLELAEARKETDQERDAFLLARMNAGQDVLAGQMKSSIQEGLQQPVAEIVSSVEKAGKVQEQTARQFNEGILNAFAAHFQQTAETLATRITDLGQRLIHERQAMEANIERLGSTISEAAKAGGEQLADNLERAMAGAEVRQDQVLESLAGFTAGLRVDLDRLQGRIQETSGDVSRQLNQHTRELVENSEAETKRIVQESSAGVVGEIKEVFEQLKNDTRSLDNSRREEISRRLDSLAHGGEAHTEALQRSMQEQLSATAGSLSDSVKQAGEVQQQQAKALADMMIAALAGRIEERFGGIDQGLNEMQGRLSEERDNIHGTLRGWIDELSQSTQIEARELSEHIHEVMKQNEQSHEGMLSALNGVGHKLDSDLSSMKDGMLAKTEEISGELIGHMDDVVTVNSREQQRFVEMLGERIESMRKHLKVK